MAQGRVDVVGEPLFTSVAVNTTTSGLAGLFEHTNGEAEPCGPAKQGS